MPQKTIALRRRIASYAVAVVSLLMMTVSIVLYRSEAKERLKIHEERDKQLLRAELIAESDGRAIIMCDEDGDITYSTSTAERMFGWTHEELAGQPSTLLIPEKSVPAHNEKMRQASEMMKAFPGNYRMTRRGLEDDGLHRNGDLIPLTMDTRVIKYSGVIEYIVHMQKRGVEPPEVEIEELELPVELSSRMSTAHRKAHDERHD
jgi:PAS domain S-box-containing protein